MPIPQKVSETQIYLRVYNILMLTLYSCLALFMFLVMLMPFSYSDYDYPYSYGRTFYFVLFCGIGLFYMIFIGIYLYATIFITKRSKLVYYINLIGLVLGFNSLIAIVPSVLLFSKMFDQELKDYYLGDR